MTGPPCLNQLGSGLTDGRAFDVRMAPLIYFFKAEDLGKGLGIPKDSTYISSGPVLISHPHLYLHFSFSV